MNVISITRLYDLLSVKIGKESAENLTTFIEEKINTELENKTQIFATKADIASLDSKIDQTNSKIEQTNLKIEQTNLKIEQTESRLELKISETKSELELKISDSKSETIKWMFIFWVGQVVATFGFILLFLKK